MSKSPFDDLKIKKLNNIIKPETPLILGYESPLELLLDTQAEIEKDLEWFSERAAATETNSTHSRINRARIKHLKASNAEYEAAISKLLRD